MHSLLLGNGLNRLSQQRSWLDLLNQISLDLGLHGTIALERAIRSAKDLHDQDEQAKSNDRTIRAQVAAAAIKAELQDILSQCYEYVLMLSAPMFYGQLDSIYEGVSEFRAPVLERFAYQSDVFGTQVGLLFMITWTEAARIKHFAAVNGRHTSKWGPETRVNRRRELRKHLRNLSRHVAAALAAAESVAGASPSEASRRSRSYALQAFADRNQTHLGGDRADCCQL